MRRIDILISLARSIAKNSANGDGTLSIPDDVALQYANDAQDRLQGLISALKSSSRLFLADKLIAGVASQERYQVPDRVYQNKQFHQVEYSATGQASDYIVLRKLELFNRKTYSTLYPYGYYRRGADFYPVAPLSSSVGTFRVMYERSCDDLDKRRGAVSSVSGLTSTTFTSLVVDSTADEASTPVNLSNVDYICICDSNGIVTAYNIPVLSYVTGTNTLTPAASFVFQNGETIANGSFITFGKYSTTHSQLPDECERYIIHYVAQSLLHQDSSEDVVTENQFLKDIETDIINQIGAQTAEVQYIPTAYDEDGWSI